MDTSKTPSYRGYRFPCEIIAHCTWLYFRFKLSFRDIQEMMLERGVDVSHETIRLWCLKFGAEYAERVVSRYSVDAFGLLLKQDRAQRARLYG